MHRDGEARARAASSAQRSGPRAPPVMTTVSGASSAMQDSTASRSVRRRLPMMPILTSPIPRSIRPPRLTRPAPQREQRLLDVPTRDREVVDHDHRGEWINNRLERRKLAVLFRVRDTIAKSVSKHLDEGHPEMFGDALREPLSETIRAARMTARDTGDRVGCPIAAQLSDERGEQHAGLIDEPLIDFPLRSPECRKVMGLTCSAPGTGRYPTDLVPPKNHRTIDQRAEQRSFQARSFRFSSACPKCGLAEINEGRHLDLFPGNPRRHHALVSDWNAEAAWVGHRADDNHRWSPSANSHASTRPGSLGRHR